MARPGLLVLNLVATTGLATLIAPGSARAQYGYPGYGPGRPGVSVQIGVGGGTPAYGYQGQPAYGGGYAGGGYCGGGYSPGYSAGYGGYGSPVATYPSPAARQGYREGQLYYETGIAPNRPLSPAEARGFAAGERRAAATPWQLDPARQQGYREGQLYYETGIAPNRPLSPAEAQGFRAGESRAASGYGPWYR